MMNELDGRGGEKKKDESESSVDGDEDEVYEVEKICSAKKEGRMWKYEVKWRGYEDTTWEPMKNLSGLCGES